MHVIVIHVFPMAHGHSQPNQMPDGNIYAIESHSLTYVISMSLQNCCLFARHVACFSTSGLRSASNLGAPILALTFELRGCAVDALVEVPARLHNARHTTCTVGIRMRGASSSARQSALVLSSNDSVIAHPKALIVECCLARAVDARIGAIGNHAGGLVLCVVSDAFLIVAARAAAVTALAASLLGRK